MGELVTKDQELKELFVMAEDLKSIQYINGKIKAQENELQSLKKPNFTKDSPSKFTYTKNADSVYNRMWWNKRKQLDHRDTFWTAILWILLSLVVLAVVALTIYFSVRFVDWAKEWFCNQTWGVFKNRTPDRMVSLYYFYLFVFAACGVFGVVYGWETYGGLDLFIKILVIAGMSIFGLVFFVKFWNEAPFWEVLLYVLFGLLLITRFFMAAFACLPYILLALEGVGIIYLIVRICSGDVPDFLESIYDFFTISSTMTKRREREIYNSAEWKRAYAEDKKEFPAQLERYTKSYNEAYDAYLECCGQIDNKRDTINNAIAEMKKMKQEIVNKVTESDLLHPDQKTYQYVAGIIYMFEHKRADSIKEAINILENQKMFAQFAKAIADYQQKMLNMTTNLVTQNKILANELQKMRNDVNHRITSLEGSINMVSKSVVESQTKMEQAVLQVGKDLDKQLKENNKNLQEINSSVEKVRSDNRVANEYAAQDFNHAVGEIKHKIDRI